MQYLTLKNYVKLCKEKDENTAINEHMLRTLFDSGVLKQRFLGNRRIIEREEIDYLFSILLKTDSSLPLHLRSIQEAGKELKGRGISEEQLRRLIKSEQIPSLLVGNRQYVALESINDEAVFHTQKLEKAIESTKQEYSYYLSNQLSNALGNQSKVSQVKRRRIVK